MLITIKLFRNRGQGIGVRSLELTNQYKMKENVKNKDLTPIFDPKNLLPEKDLHRHNLNDQALADC